MAANPFNMAGSTGAGAVASCLRELEMHIVDDETGDVLEKVRDYSRSVDVIAAKRLGGCVGVCFMRVRIRGSLWFGFVSQILFHRHVSLGR